MSLIRESEQEEILHCAFRYALGRATYVTGFMADSIIYAWPNLSQRMRNMILKEIVDAFGREEYGMQMDKEQWQRVIDHANGASRAA